MKWLALISLLLPLVVAEEVTFETADLKINHVKLHVKVADTEARRERGLMFVKSLPANEGMLFVFDEERMQNFWMKNTLIPLSIGFFDKSGLLIDVQEMKPSESLMDATPPSYQSAGPALMALEMNAGWFKKNHLDVGARLSVDRAGKSALLKRKLPPSARQTSSGKVH